ncbi:HAD hydrolase-like protein [Odoribacter sp. OttesenSCG-928-L07]|nr:HAD hydrolase-like protein [Odoribacter sp. OttesenSCG-928-L07]MDL2239092.1 HAD hydrolase-like protein [Bacteroidales bacterium OttesenSCG-928-L14]MDL2240005.1 HAD hydrolase-like protein [Bacteroidales bacterium OttesenSCG-928-K22]
MKKITTIAFDADDTLWINEPYFREAEENFCKLFEPNFSRDETAKLLFDIEIKNLPYNGYGVKNFIISAVEVVCQLYDSEIQTELLNKTLKLGRDLLTKTNEKINGVEVVLKKLQENYRLVLITKGDLIDQTRKINQSGLKDYFDHIEIVSYKTCDDYRDLLRKINCKNENFAMVGNSLKSDILPVLELDSYAIHIPFPVTWEHEQHHEDIIHPKFISIEKITDLLEIF